MTHDELKLIKKQLAIMREGVAQIMAETDDLVIDDEESYRRTLQQFDQLRKTERSLRTAGDDVIQRSANWHNDLLNQVGVMRDAVDQCAAKVSAMLVRYESQNVRDSHLSPETTCQGFTGESNNEPSS